MAKDDAKREDPDDGDEPVQPRPFWSGIIAFGLVSLPVSLFPAHRGKAITLSMVDAEGVPLKRQFYCSQEEKPLERDEIVRGYAVDKDHYLAVEDEELEALAPEKTREIDLKRFVPLESLNPVYFVRAYFLVPDGDTNKAYRLLARTMEEEQRAGIASFVMRGKEYLVAIIAESGILRAEILRFHDELRSPAEIGLPERQAADPTRLAAFSDAMRRATLQELDRDDLHDAYTRSIERRIQDKRKEGRDLLPAPEEPEQAAAEETNVIDLMQVLKERLQGRQSDEPRQRAPQREKRPARSRLSQLSKDELYEQARTMDIPGRSKMSKQQLIDAISHR